MFKRRYAAPWRVVVLSLLASFLVATGHAAPARATLPEPTLPPGQSVPNPIGCGTPYYGSFYLNEPSDNWQVPHKTHKWTMNCFPSPRPATIRTWHEDGNPLNYTDIEFCLDVGSQAYFGYRQGASYEIFAGESTGDILWRGDCTPPSPTEPPVNAVSGQVVADRRAGGGTVRPLRGAMWQLWYEGRGGGSSDPVEWRQVRQQPGGVGAPVEGYLDDDGRFDISFIYPQQYPHEGQLWHGCEPTPVAYLQSFACADDKLVLRVFPANADRSVRVLEPDHNDLLQPMLTIPLGLHFQRPPGEVHNAVGAAAQAYTAAYNVKDLVRYDFGTINIELNRDDDSSYNPLTTSINLDVSDAETGVAEHEVGHRLLHAYYGLDYFRWQSNCLSHVFTEPSSDECGWGEGWAQFVAVAAENDPGATTWTKRTATWGTHDLETCATTYLSDGRAVACQPGAAVEGRVAAALWDLIDTAPESGDGFGDRSTVYDFDDILDVVTTAHPATFIDFWRAWRQWDHSRVADSETMWLNTLGYAAVADEDLGYPTGIWKPLDCAPCVESDALVVAEPDRGFADLTWYVDSAQLKDHNRWEIWVRIPEADGSLESDALYEVTSGSTSGSVTVDQNERSGWINLKADGFAVDPDGSPIKIRVTYRTGWSGNTYLAADAVVVTPHFTSP